MTSPFAKRHQVDISSKEDRRLMTVRHACTLLFVRPAGKATSFRTNPYIFDTDFSLVPEEAIHVHLGVIARG